MTDSKPIASLGPMLLARKGSARPAMRSQTNILPVQPDSEDLGWNDMGHNADPATDFVPHVPAVVRQQREVASRINAERRSALADGRPAAFTLRVNAERHLKLRLACAIRGRSAQQLVTDALDALLNDLPELADLAAQVAKKHR